MSGTSEPAPATPPPAPPDADPWSIAALGAHAIALPASPDPCATDVPVVLVTEEAAWARRRGEAELAPLEPAPTVDDAIAGVVAGAFGLVALSGSFEGPGGDRLFRWHVGFPQPIVIVDERVSAARFEAVVRAIATARPYAIRLGGVAPDGGRACAGLAFDGLFDDPELNVGYPVEAVAAEDGTLTVTASSGAVPPFEVRPGAAPAWPTDRGIQPIGVSGASPVAMIRGASLVRHGDRWPVFFTARR